MRRLQVLRKIITALLLGVSSGIVGATAITLESDDYALGTDLSSISPYVRLGGWLAGTHSTVPIIASSVPMNDAGVRYSAPTGNSVFGYASSGYGGGFAGGGCNSSLQLNELAGCQGFNMSFDQDVSDVSLLAMNWGYEPSLGARWYAWNEAGILIGNGQVWPESNIGVPFVVNIDLDDIRTVVIGGAAGVGAMSFDHLIFNVAAVPEPSSLTLIIAGVALFGARRLVRTTRLISRAHAALS